MYDRAANDLDPITSWEHTKAEKVAVFILENYERDLFARVQRLKQGYMSVKKYLEQF